jgi:transposase-like protein
MVNPLAETYLNEANKLDGSNFINWKFKMQMLMEGYGVWNIAKGTELKPDALQVRQQHRSKIGRSAKTRQRYCCACQLKIA